MARRPVDNETLLKHAREVFLEHGSRARTKDVAQRAGVSEALLFKRFGSREALFTASMAADFRHQDADWIADLEASAGVGNVTEHLERCGVAAIAYFERMMPVVMMTWTGLPEEAMASHASPDAAPFEARRRVEAWFERERQLGRIRRCDPEIVARIYLGSLYNHASWEATLGPYDPRPLGRAAFVRGLVHVLWQGLAPAEEPHVV